MCVCVYVSRKMHTPGFEEVLAKISIGLGKLALPTRKNKFMSIVLI